MLLAILMAEVNDSEPWAPVDTAWQLAQLGMQRLGIYSWLKRKLSGKGDTPPSLGWGNIQEETFHATQDKHSAELSRVYWSDLIGDNDLAIKVTAYRIRDLQDFVEGKALSTDVKHRYGTEELTAAGYRAGEANLEAAFDSGHLGPEGEASGEAYAKEMQRNFQQADQIICRSGYWTCS